MAKDQDGVSRRGLVLDPPRHGEHHTNEMARHPGHVVFLHIPWHMRHLLLYRAEHHRLWDVRCDHRDPDCEGKRGGLPSRKKDSPN